MLFPRVDGFPLTSYQCILLIGLGDDFEDAHVGVKPSHYRGILEKIIILLSGVQPLSECLEEYCYSSFQKTLPHIAT